MPKNPDFLLRTGAIILTEEETRQWDAVNAGETFAEMIADERLFPRDNFFIGFVFDGDMGDVDICGWNFSGADLSGANMSQVKNITGAHFDANTKFDNTKLPEGITVQMLV